MFQLTEAEYESLRSQFVTLEKGRGKFSKYMPYAFTGYGILMLSSVLNNNRAINVNIQIMRTFTKLRQMMITYEELKNKIDDMENRYDRQFRAIFDALRRLIIEEEKPVKKIGY